MKDVMGKNISRLRKEQKLTQENLARAVGVSAQAVSKWESGQSYPDIEVLPKLTDILETNIDSLLGHIPGDLKKTLYQAAYLSDDYYWGLQPNDLCYEVLRLVPPGKDTKLLEIGCGEGKDAFFFARNGYNVTAFDIAQSGINKLQRLAEMYHLHINAFRADMLSYRLQEEYDVIYSSRALHHIKPELRKEIFENYKQHTKLNGINAMNVYLRKPFIEPPPEQDDFAYLWESGELLMKYSDWRIKLIEEKIYDCMSSNVKHQHAIDIMIAEKVM
ncbi:MAG: methyltransferase domain-containing protein [Oscillospiraceae bacterium]|nr:methyltransferase domain-containing protein [Oscillospiraceae bacterium]